MNYEINHDTNRGICVFTVSGEIIRPDDSIKLHELTRNIFSEKGCKRFLIDMRQANLTGQGIKTYEVGVAPEKRKANKSVVIALVYSGNMKQPKFLEDVLVNRGFNARVFNNIDVAFEWLTS